MVDLKWCRCPKCGEIGDLKRLGKPFSIGTKRKSGGAPAWNATVLTSSVCTLVRCGFCGSTFNTSEPTRLEAFGFDGNDDTSF